MITAAPALSPPLRCLLAACPPPACLLLQRICELPSPQQLHDEIHAVSLPVILQHASHAAVLYVQQSIHLLLAV